MTDEHEGDATGRAEPCAPESGPAAARRLINLGADERHNTADLNAQLAAFEQTLLDLRAGQAETGAALARLAAETRSTGDGQAERLREARTGIDSVQATCRKLQQDSQRLAAGANILNANIAGLQKDTESELSVLRESTDQITGALAEAQAALGVRVGALEEKAARLAADLETRVRVVDGTISALDRRLREEMSEESRLRQAADEYLAGRADTLEQAARRLGDETADLQVQVNVLDGRGESLEERADDLEARADGLDAATVRLGETAADLQRQVGVLEGRGDFLDGRADALEERADNLDGAARRMRATAADLQLQVSVLEDRDDALEARADGLRDAGERQGLRLAALGRAVSRNFKQQVGAFVLVAVTLVSLVVFIQGRWEGVRAADEALLTADQALHRSDAALGRRLADRAAIAAVDEARLQALGLRTEQRLSSQQAMMARQQAEIARLRDALGRVRDTARNSAARVDAMPTSRAFGLDNSIHAPSWLAWQDPAASVIEVSTVDSRQALYEFAHRWSNVLDEAHLSYTEKGDGKAKAFTLVYGPIADAALAERLSRRLPRSGGGRGPVVRRLSDML